RDALATWTVHLACLSMPLSSYAFRGSQGPKRFKNKPTHIFNSSSPYLLFVCTVFHHGGYTISYSGRQTSCSHYSLFKFLTQCFIISNQFRPWHSAWKPHILLLASRSPYHIGNPVRNSAARKRHCYYRVRNHSM